MSMREWWMKKLSRREFLAIQFSKRVKRSGKCLLWTGNIDTEGYGRLKVYWGKWIRAPRLAWYLHYGKWPKHVIDHARCQNRACVDWSHFEDVPSAVNVLRGNSLAAINARKTHCKNNHPLSGDNLCVTRQGARQCRACRRAYMDSYRSQKGKLPEPLEKL